MKTVILTTAALISIGAGFFITTAFTADFFTLPRTDPRPITFGFIASFLILSAEIITLGFYIQKKEQQK